MCESESAKSKVNQKILTNRRREDSLFNIIINLSLKKL